MRRWTDKTAQQPEAAVEERPSLSALTLSEAGYQSVSLVRGATEILIGRASEADVPIDDASVSRRHAMVRISETGTFEVTDLGSANGTRHAGRQLEQGVATPFSLGETLLFGSAVFVIQDRTVGSVPTVLGRDQFEARVSEECIAARNSGARFAIMHLDLSRAISSGELVTALAPVLRQGTPLGRLTANQYALLIRDGAPEVVTQLCRGSLTKHAIAARIGAVEWPTDGSTAPELLHAAADRAKPETRRTVFGATMTALLRDLDRVASSDLAILLIGETGTGKEVLADRVHRHSMRAEKPFVRFNCAALSPGLVESELFGHERGAFTGADRAKTGLFEAAHGGTIFLDEIGEIALNIQAKLLRVLEERQVRRVGGIEPRPVDVRLISATNRNLVSSIEQHLFREDLYYRISSEVIEIPPLRDRRDDVLALARMFVGMFSERAGIPTPALSRAAETVLTTYQWPGNVRELRNVIERAVVLCEGETIEARHFPIERMQGPPRKSVRFGIDGDHDGEPTKVNTSSKPKIDREELERVLDKHNGNQRTASAELGVHRRTLMRWMDTFKIQRPRKG